MAFNSKGALGGGLSGAASGAAIGSAVPGVGTAIGAGVGLLAGGLAGGFSGDQKAPGYSKGDLDYIASQRSQQIGRFGEALTAARNQYYQTTLPNFQKYALGRFMPNIEANLAGRGLAFSGGAYASNVGRYSSDLAAGGLEGEYRDRLAALNAVNNAEGSLASSQLQGGYQNFAVPAPNNTLADALSLAGQIGTSYLGSRANSGRVSPLGTAMGQASSGSIIDTSRFLSPNLASGNGAGNGLNLNIPTRMYPGGNFMGEQNRYRGYAQPRQF